MNIFMMKNCGYFHKSGNILGVISIHFSAFSTRRTRVTLFSQAKLFQLLQKLQTDSSHARLDSYVPTKILQNVGEKQSIMRLSMLGVVT